MRRRGHSHLSGSAGAMQCRKTRKLAEATAILGNQAEQTRKGLFCRQKGLFCRQTFLLPYNEMVYAPMPHAVVRHSAGVAVKDKGMPRDVLDA